MTTDRLQREFPRRDHVNVLYALDTRCNGMIGGNRESENIANSQYVMRMTGGVPLNALTARSRLDIPYEFGGTSGQQPSTLPGATGYRRFLVRTPAAPVPPAVCFPCRILPADDEGLSGFHLISPLRRFTWMGYAWLSSARLCVVVHTVQRVQ